jgi:hypothetical protein
MGNEQIEPSWELLKAKDAQNTVFAGYPANLKAGYRIPDRIFGFYTTGIFLVE